jgi:hypothetical protein
MAPLNLEVAYLHNRLQLQFGQFPNARVHILDMPSFSIRVEAVETFDGRDEDAEHEEKFHHLDFRDLAAIDAKADRFVTDFAKKRAALFSGEFVDYPDAEAPQGDLREALERLESQLQHAVGELDALASAAAEQQEQSLGRDDALAKRIASLQVNVAGHERDLAKAGLITSPEGMTGKPFERLVDLRRAHGLDAEGPELVELREANAELQQMEQRATAEAVGLRGLLHEVRRRVVDPETRPRSPKQRLDDVLALLTEAGI